MTEDYEKKDGRMCNRPAIVYMIVRLIVSVIFA